MATQGRKRSTGPSAESIIAGLLGLLLLAFLGRLYQAISKAPALGVPGLVLLLVGATILAWSVLRRRRLAAKTLADLLALTPSEFEHATAELLRLTGYQDVRTNGGSGDLNVDVWARDASGARVAVQCKQYGPRHPVGSPEVQMFIGMIYQHHRAGRGIFVTTSRFSAPAVTLANEHKIILWDGEALARKLADATSKAAVNRTERIRSRVAAISSLPLGLLLLAGAWIQTDQVTPTPSSQSVQANAAARIPAFAPVGTSATLSPTRQPVPTLVAATVRVANTGGVGVYIRRTPNPDDKIRAYQDGSPMTIVGSDIVVGSTRWRHVLAADRTDGYVPAEYVQ